MGRRPKEKKENTASVSKLAYNYDALEGEMKESFEACCAELNEFNIIRLREIGESIPGVDSPTTKSKEDLLKSIAAARIAQIRYIPPRLYEFSPVTEKEALELTDDYLFRTYVKGWKLCEGILHLRGDGGWIQERFWPNLENDIFVPMFLINRMRLQDGDVLKGKARFLERASIYGFYFLESVNGMREDKFKRPQEQKALKCSKPLKMIGGTVLDAVNIISPFYFGQKKLIIGLDAINLEPLAGEIIGCLNKQGVETVSLFFDSLPENIAAMSFAGKSLALDCAQQEGYNDAAMLAVNYAKTKAALGQNIAVIIGGADVLSEPTLRKLFAAGINSDEGTFTVIAMSSSLELTPAVNKIARAANSIAVLKKGLSSLPLIDLIQSYSDPQVNQNILDDCRLRLNQRFVSCKELVSFYSLSK